MDTVVKNLEALLDVQAALRTAAEAQARSACQALRHVAETLCGPAVDRIRREDPDGIGHWPPDEVADLIIDEVGRELDKVDLARVNDNALGLYWQANTEMDRLREDLAQAQERIDDLDRIRQTLEQEVNALQAGPEAAGARPDDPEQTQAHREVIKLLERAGYSVSRFSRSGGKDFAPDLQITRPGGEPLWVELEWDTEGSAQKRNPKWDRYFQKTRGRFAVITPDRPGMDVIRSEIVFWADLNGRPLRLCMTNLDDLRGQTGDRAGGENGIWTVRID